MTILRSSLLFRLRVPVVMVLSAVAVMPVPAQQKPLQTILVGIDRRTGVTSLNGEWHSLVDQPPASALYNAKGQVRDNSYARNTHPNITSGPHNDEYDFATAPTLKVPGDWNTQEPTLFRFEGVVWYQRDFDVQPKPGTRTFLHIGAANYMSHVWVNATRICDHEGGYTPFDCEVTEAIHPGSNFVVIAVDSTRHADDIPTLNHDWFNYGGITRDVSLVTVPTAFIDDYDVHLQHGASFTNTTQLEGYVHVAGAQAGTDVRVRIPEAGVDTTVKTDAEGRAPLSVKASSLTLWAPGSPKLYRVELSSGQDSLTDEMGFRDIRVDGTRILLNGKAVFLKGVNMHAEAPVRGGVLNTDADVGTAIGYLKGMNANFVRLAHYPHDERMLRAADREGIMVWSEIPLWQRISFEKPEVYAKAVAMLHEMIRRDHNKAAIILWSVSNETPNNPARTEFLTNLANEARKTDPTRLITSALIGPQPHGHEMVQDDPLANALDVVGQNEYIGWYLMKPEEADDVKWTLPNKPILVSEFGAEAKEGNHGGPDDRWAEEQQVNVYKHQFAMIEKIPQVRGLIPWVLVDFRSPVRNIPKLQDGKGLISNEGKKKPAYELFRQVYAENSVGKAE